MHQPSDAELVARCLNGSEDAFGELVDRYKHLVFGVISQVTPDRSRVEDLAQDVFLKVHRGLPTFRGDAKLSTWIYRIVRNVCNDAFQREPATTSLTERGDDGGLRYEPPVRDRASADLELRDRLEKAIAQLPVDQRFLISAFYFGGQQYQELSDILEIPIGTVKTHLHRAKRRLREVLQEGTSE